MIEINTGLCIGCENCIKDCTAKVLKMEDGKAVWTSDCLHCGHCVAICPANAISIPDYDMAEVCEYDKDTFEINPTNYLNAIKFRRSIRDFRPKPIEQAKMERIINAGRYSATANNTQGCKFIVLNDELDDFKELVWQEIPKVVEVLMDTVPSRAIKFKKFYQEHMEDSKNDMFFFNTPSFLVIATDNPWDGGLAAANIENMAVAEGAGVLYSGYMKRVINASPVLKEWLGISDSEASCCLLIGHPNVTYKRTAPRKKGNIQWR